MTEITLLYVAPDGRTQPAPDRLTDGLEVTVLDSSSLAGAKELLEEATVDCLVTAYDLPDATGLDLIRHVRETAPDTGSILYTDVDRETIAAEVDDRIVTDFVHKDGPAAADRLAELVAVTARRRTQTSYPLPEDEGDRLATLDGFDLHSPSLDRAFDRVTALAAGHFDVDRAAINVVHAHTQEVVACRGADWTTIPREETICTYTILDDDVTVIADTAADPRFEESEALADLDIRFYAGAPLTTDAGQVIGTVCIYDDRSRELSGGERRYLQLLADEAMHWIDLHGRLAGPREDEAVEAGVGQ